MLATIFSFIISVMMICIILYTGHVHAHLSLDHDLNGVQKHHEEPTPRIGGLAIFISMIFTALYGANIRSSWAPFFCGLITSLFFAFLGGLTEDLSKAVSPMLRVCFIVVAILFGIFVSHSIPMIHHLDYELFTHTLHNYAFLAFILTTIAIIGISNAFNLIDGYNGLSATTALINVLGLGYLGYVLNDHVLTVISCIFAFSILGFLVFNYPLGKIFLGDGGAYLLGFSIAVLSINLVEQHAGRVSPFAVLLLTIYPFTETIITIIRRKFIHRTRLIHPDNWHLHQLVFNCRLLKPFPLSKKNYLVMPLMLILMVPQNIVVFFFYQSSLLMLGGIFIYIVFYIGVYLLLVRLRHAEVKDGKSKMAGIS